jgi:hypothetical protein
LTGHFPLLSANAGIEWQLNNLHTPAWFVPYSVPY